MSPTIIRLRHVPSVLALLALAACGGFEPGDEPPPGAPVGKPGPTQASAEEGSKPPVPGAPLEGVFVSSSRGSDDGDGSMQKPFKTLGAAIGKAQTNGKRVLACAETYAEQLVLQSGVSVYGYFSCDAGAFVLAADKRARVESPFSPALVAEKIALPTRVEGFEVAAPDGTDASPSSIAARVADSKGLTIGKSSLRAGSGKDGVDGVEAPQTAPAGQDGARGLDIGTCVNAPFPCYRAGGVNPSPGGAGGASIVCGGGVMSNKGGDGGAGANQRSPGASATSGGGGGPSMALGGQSGDIAAFPGGNGADGARGADGQVGAVRLTEEGPQLVAGTAGANGELGQGGGGGGGLSRNGDTNDYSASGGGGGSGGCPGFAGKPGGSGGASVAAWVVRSEVSMEDVVMEAGSGGRAGAGTVGTAPTPGGNGASGGGGGVVQSMPGPFGVPIQTVIGVIGGAGGNGGAGGAAGVSGHGAPGPSIGMVVFGAKPAIKGGSIKPGAGGEGAPELAPGLPATGPGPSVDVLVVK